MFTGGNQSARLLVLGLALLRLYKGGGGQVFVTSSGVFCSGGSIMMDWGIRRKSVFTIYSPQIQHDKPFMCYITLQWRS